MKKYYIGKVFQGDLCVESFWDINRLVVENKIKEVLEGKEKGCKSNKICRIIEKNYPECPPIIGYTEEQAAIIKNEVEECLCLALRQNWVQYFWSDKVIKRGPQKFAIFGDTAREILNVSEIKDEEAHIQYLPVMVDGKMLEECPEEGSSGLLYLMRMFMSRGKPRSGEWSTVFLNTGWLYTEELKLSNQEILYRLMDEVDAGNNVFSTSPPGLD